MWKLALSLLVMLGCATIAQDVRAESRTPTPTLLAQAGKQPAAAPAGVKRRTTGVARSGAVVRKRLPARAKAAPPAVRKAKPAPLRARAAPPRVVPKAKAAPIRSRAAPRVAPRPKQAPLRAKAAPRAVPKAAPARAAAARPATGRYAVRPRPAAAPAAAAVPQQRPPAVNERGARTLSFFNLHTRESITVTYRRNGAYVRSELARLNRFLRDVRDGDQTQVDPALFDILWHVRSRLRTSAPYHVVSAYRSPQTNAWLASVSSGVASNSLHMQGRAMDVRLPGRSPGQIRAAAMALRMGGVGFYPRTGFVHIDTGPVRQW